MRELKIFLTAVMFYTRIPCPKWVDHRPEFINLSIRYFSFIGWIVGLIYSVSIIAAAVVFDPLLSVLIGLVTSVFLTGAFHEDGFADVCDGFGGGWTKEKILLIMKDSRIGTYGVVGLLLIVAIKVTATIQLLQLVSAVDFLIVIIASHALSRAMAAAVAFAQPYAREDDDAKAKPLAKGITFFNTAIAFVFALVPLGFLMIQKSWILVFVLVPMVVITTYLSRYFKKWIGGYTGDCLGAIQQVNEVVILLVITGVWKFI